MSLLHDAIRKIKRTWEQKNNKSTRKYVDLMNVVEEFGRKGTCAENWQKEAAKESAPKKEDPANEDSAREGSTEEDQAKWDPASVDWAEEDLANED